MSDREVSDRGGTFLIPPGVRFLTRLLQTLASSLEGVEATPEGQLCEGLVLQLWGRGLLDWGTVRACDVSDGARPEALYVAERH